MSHGTEIIRGELWTKGNRVYYVGPEKPAEIAFDREIDLSGNLVMPGFKNAHTHSAMTFLRSYADDLPLLDWLNNQVFPMEAKLKGEDVYWLSTLAIMEYLQSGITANMDMYMFPEQSIKAATDSGFRSVICGVLHNYIGSLKELESNYDRYNAHHELISAQLCFHAEYTCSPELLSGISEIVNRRKLPIFTHSSESAREVAECIKRTGKTPTSWLDSFGIFEYGGGNYHCVHMTDDDLAIMKQHSMAVITCPGSNTKLASGIARLSDMLELGIPVAIGTDGPASNNCLDMFREMFLATGLQKLALNDASALAADEVLRMATVNGSRIMGHPECDTLAKNKLADLIVIDMAQPNMQPLNNIIKNIVYSGSKQNIKLTMVNGKILYEDGQFFIGKEPVDVYAKVNEITISMRQE